MNFCITLKILLITKQTRESAFIALKRLGVSGVFDDVISREDSLLREKQLRVASDTLGAKLVHVGDTLVDAVSALRARAIPVLVTGDRYGFHQGNELGVPVFENVLRFVETLTHYIERYML